MCVFVCTCVYMCVRGGQPFWNELYTLQKDQLLNRFTSTSVTRLVKGRAVNLDLGQTLL
jgi:hypothetical protein